MLFEKIIYKGKEFRKYDETKISVWEVFIIETEFKWKELIKKGYIIKHIKCENKNNRKIEYENIVKFKNIKEKSDVNKEIKKDQKKDIIKIIKEIKPEILYIIPNLNENEEYKFDLITIIKEEESIKNLNLKLIKINNEETIKYENINFNLIEKILKINNNVINDNIIQIKNKKDMEINNKKNEKKYVEKILSLICIQINIIEKNEEKEDDDKIKEELNLDFDFATNYDETKNKINNNKKNLFLTTLSDNFDKLNISLNTINIKIIKSIKE